jgi:hypothetical protein
LNLIELLFVCAVSVIGRSAVDAALQNKELN